MIQFFNYGLLNKKSIPSKLRMERKNLGQSASQVHCLMLNIPFILFPYKKKLSEIWSAVANMLRILGIAFSEAMSQNELNDLDVAIESHLKIIIDKFGGRLLPKHHLLLHYTRVIRKMGPLLPMWNMRFEAKHQYFKR